MKLSESARARLASQHLTIPEIISGVPEARIHFNPMPGKWSIHDNIAHLARYNVIFQERLNTIMSADAPVFPRYNADEDTLFPQWQQMQTPALLSSVSAEREKIFSLAKTFSGNDLARTGMHPKFGNLTMLDWLEFFLLHEAHHIFTMFRLKNDVSLPASQ
jgi:hypothetical protein